MEKIKEIKGIIHQSLPPILKSNDTLFSSSSAISDAFAQSFAKNSCDSNFDPAFTHYKPNIENTITYELQNNFHHQDNHLNTSFNENELFNAMSNCKSKSPRPDDISYSFIHNLSPYGKNQVLKIYNTIWNNGIFLDQWRNAIIIPILKPNKNKYDITNYRPISLINTIGKNGKQTPYLAFGDF
jgi:hypothetical protein